MERPSDVIENLYDGTYYRMSGDRNVMVCEDCWQNIPPYRDFPRGLVSPESEDPAGNFSKTRRTMLGTDGGPRPAIEHLQKVVCLPCYMAAYMRHYGPVAPLPELSQETHYRG